MFDLDAFEERAAIMEFDGGLSRFRAETLAAQAQGVSRHAAIGFRNSQQARHIGSTAFRNAANNLPAMQSPSQEEARSVPVGDVHGGRDTLAMLAWGV